MAKPRPKPPTIILDNGCGDAQNLLEDSVFVGLIQKLIEAVNRLYAEDGFGGLSLKLGRKRNTSPWQMVVLAEVRLSGATLSNVEVEVWSGGTVDIREKYERIETTKTILLATDFYNILRGRAKSLGSHRK
ncbi:MAG: hypothetical protein LiPW15_339 [Parcubacteria group bacterium LiPW_15]|nr:MAG: hypothetical protein LiPW15_339 [Parcubacteria group bacterium LiPW_15]